MNTGCHDEWGHLCQGAGKANLECPLNQPLLKDQQPQSKQKCLATNHSCRDTGVHPNEKTGIGNMQLLQKYHCSHLGWCTTMWDQGAVKKI